jgi:hypothetical protein
VKLCSLFSSLDKPCSTVKWDVENDMEGVNWGLAMEVWVLVVQGFWRCDSWLIAAELASGGDIIGGIGRVKTQGLTLISYACQQPSWRHCFLSVRTFSGVKIYGHWLGQWRWLCIFPSWRGRFWSWWISGAVLVLFGPLLQWTSQCSVTFILCNCFFVVCSCVYLHY